MHIKSARSRQSCSKNWSTIEGSTHLIEIRNTVNIKVTPLLSRSTEVHAVVRVWDSVTVKGNVSTEDTQLRSLSRNLEGRTVTTEVDVLASQKRDFTISSHLKGVLVDSKGSTNVCIAGRRNRTTISDGTRIGVATIGPQETISVELQEALLTTGATTEQELRTSNCITHGLAKLAYKAQLATKGHLVGAWVELQLGVAIDRKGLSATSALNEDKVQVNVLG